MGLQPSDKIVQIVGIATAGLDEAQVFGKRAERLHEAIQLGQLAYSSAFAAGYDQAIEPFQVSGQPHLARFHA